MMVSQVNRFKLSKNDSHGCPFQFGFSNQKYGLPTLLVLIQDWMVTVKTQAHVGSLFFPIQDAHEENKITMAKENATADEL